MKKKQKKQKTWKKHRRHSRENKKVRDAQFQRYLETVDLRKFVVICPTCGDRRRTIIIKKVCRDLYLKCKDCGTEIIIDDNTTREEITYYNWAVSQ